MINAPLQGTQEALSSKEKENKKEKEKNKEIRERSFGRITSRGSIFALEENHEPPPRQA